MFNLVRRPAPGSLVHSPKGRGRRPPPDVKGILVAPAIQNCLQQDTRTRGDA